MWALSSPGVFCSYLRTHLPVFSHTVSLLFPSPYLFSTLPHYSENTDVIMWLSIVYRIEFKLINLAIGFFTTWPFHLNYFIDISFLVSPLLYNLWYWYCLPVKMLCFPASELCHVCKRTSFMRNGDCPALGVGWVCFLCSSGRTWTVVTLFISPVSRKLWFRN